MPLEASKIFGANLRAARLRLGLSQSEVADKAGIGKTSEWYIESGRRNLTFRTAEDLARAVGSTMIGLLTGPAIADEAAAANSHSEAPLAIQTSGQLPLKEGRLAMEFPPGAAFVAAQASAASLGQQVALYDPITRVIAGVASPIKRNE
jgi:transcriptional regulator with XRE-family HTH domain